MGKNDKSALKAEGIKTDTNNLIEEVETFLEKLKKITHTSEQRSVESAAQALYNRVQAFIYKTSPSLQSQNPILMDSAKQVMDSLYTLRVNIITETKKIGIELEQ
jgi:signal-transduction protein with cAMP-binding, CBS, and nucleotidyltransferase domain